MAAVNPDVIVSFIDDFESLTTQVRQDFYAASNEEKHIFLCDCEDMLASCIMIERELRLSGSETKSTMQIVTASVVDLVSYIEELLIRQACFATPGRPQMDIPEVRLRFLHRNDFNLSDMAHILNCSTRTVQRRLQELGLNRRQRYSNMSDSDLDDQVLAIQSRHANSGCRMIEGIFRSWGAFVQRRRIRESLHRVDPYGSAMRLTRAIHRRVYSVPSPNALWHIDSNHKLVRWRLVIHGSIDGFSRMVLNLHVAANNRSDTVFWCFRQAIERYGLPTRVRSDMGGENILVAEFMLSHPQRGSGCMITGRSVHNQRIERLWRDVFSECTSYYYALFYALEDSGVLDPQNEVDLFALHFVFLEEIQQELDQFKDSWNHHRMRTCQNRTPTQQWILGLRNYSLNHPNDPAITGLVNDLVSCNFFYNGYY